MPGGGGLGHKNRRGNWNQLWPPVCPGLILVHVVGGQREREQRGEAKPPWKHGLFENSIWKVTSWSSEILLNLFILNLGVQVPPWLRPLALVHSYRMRKVGCLNPGRNRPSRYNGQWLWMSSVLVHVDDLIGKYVNPCHKRRGMLKNPHYLMAQTAERQSKLNTSPFSWRAENNKEQLCQVDALPYTLAQSILYLLQDLWLAGLLPQLVD